VHSALVITYALGLRPHETLAITLKNLDMDNSVITISHSKFYQSRLVPFNQQLKKFIQEYIEWKMKRKHSLNYNAPLFMGKNNHPFSIHAMRRIFKTIRVTAGVNRNDGATYQPRIHDLRHAFAVNRLTSWYQQNLNVQQLLPILSIYLGHTCLAHTTVYLTMTDGLLQEAGNLFENYVTGEQR
jgi:integrase